MSSNDNNDCSILIFKTYKEAKKIVDNNKIVGVIFNSRDYMMIMTRKIYDEHYPYNKLLVDIFDIDKPTIRYDEKNRLWIVGWSGSSK